MRARKEAFVLGCLFSKNDRTDDVRPGQFDTLSSSVSRSVMAAALVAGGSLLPGASVAYGQAATNVTLSGQQTTTQAITGSPVIVTTAPLFGVDTTSGQAISIGSSGGASFTDANRSTITGQLTGIAVNNTTSGLVTITTNGIVTSRSSSGISAFSTAPDGITISAATVSGFFDGITATGPGTMSITATGTVTGTTARGVNATSAGGGTGLTLSMADVSGSSTGISAVNNGSGVLSIGSTGTVTGTLGSGIYARTQLSGSGLTITGAAVSGGTTGIDAVHQGTGALSVTTSGRVTGTAGRGIYALSGFASSDITLNLAGVSGGTSGIVANHDGTGDLTITTTGGSVDALDGVGISATNATSGNNISISTAAVSGTSDAIYAFHRGSEALSITSTGTISGANGRGIYARAFTDTTDTTISTMAVNGGTQGIYARNSGTGALSITAQGAVTGIAGSGIFARNDEDATDLEITATAVSGAAARVIDARNYGTGTLSITTTGAVSGGDNGIYAINYGGTDLAIQTAAVTGSVSGILAYSLGTGALTVTSTGAVTGSGTDYGSHGIRALTQTTTTDMTISTAAVTGGNIGIGATHNGTGALAITSNGTVTGTRDRGITATNTATGTSLSVSAAGASGANFGINVQNFGSGPLTVNTTGTVSGGQTGISAENLGAGAVSIVSTGTVTGTGVSGIYARNRASGNGLSVSAATVSGGTEGISARNDGAGALSVTATGTVTGTNGDAILAINATTGSGITIAAASVSGSRTGIDARNNGTGALSITTTGAVSASAGTGIFANGYGAGQGITVAAAAVSGFYDGIYARHNAGSVSITTTGDIAGESRTGINVQNTYRTTDMTIVATNVSGGRNGISAFHNGTGAASVSATGTVTGGSFGLSVGNRNGTTTSIAAVDVTGKYNGIFADHNGSAGLTVTATGSVSATEGGGVSLRSTGASATANVATVEGSTYGLRATNYGPGAMSITATGAVNGTSDEGIHAQNGFVRTSRGELTKSRGSSVVLGGTDLTISTAAVSGGTDGIYALNNGTGALSITTTGTVTGTSGRGIFAGNGGSVSTVQDDDYGDYIGIILSAPGIGSAAAATTTETITNAGTSLTVSASTVSGGTDGIYARNFGTGALTVTATGTVTGTTGRGIYAKNANTASALSINAAGVAGAVAGIETLNEGTGATSITTTGAVTGSAGQGIFAQNGATATGLTVNAGSVSGTTNGIEAVNSGTGPLVVTASGAVRGGSGAGISTQSNAGSTVTINLTPTASVSATSGAAIVDGDGNATMTLGAGTLVTGSIALGAGKDTLTIAEGASLAGITTLDGGAGAFIDTLNLNTQFTGAINSWEIVNANTSNGNITLNGGISGADQFNKSGTGILTITGPNALTGPTVVSGGRLVVNGSLAGSAVTVQNGASLGGTGTTGSLNALSGSIIAPGNSIGTLSVNGNLSLAAGSTLSIEVSPTSADMIAVTGTASIAGNLVIIPEAGNFSARSYTLITASAVSGTFATTTYGSLASAFRTSVVYTGTTVSLRLDPNSLVDIAGGTLRGNALAVARSFDTAVAGGYNPQAFFNLYALGANLPAALGQFSGELHSAERRVALQDSRTVRETAFDRLNDGLFAGAGSAAVTNEDVGSTRTIWMRAAGSWGKAKADGVGARFTTDQTGFLLGADFANDGFKLGGMFNYLSTDLEFAALGKSRIETIGGALYAGYRQEDSGFAIGAGWAMAHNTAEGTRAISVPGFAQTLRSTVNGTAHQVFGEVAYDMVRAGNARVEPFARIAYTVLDSKALAEAGGIAALSGRKQSNALTLSTFGLRGGIVAGKTTFSGSAGWQLTTGDRAAPTTMSVAGVNTPFVVQGVALDREAAALEAQANFSVSARFNLSLGYSGLIGKRNSDHGARATARLAF